MIARHILEHCIDSVSVIKEWARLLKPNGKLIVAVPNEDIIRGIPMNPEHVHAFSPSSMKSLMEMCGLKEVEVIDPKTESHLLEYMNRGTKCLGWPYIIRCYTEMMGIHYLYGRHKRREKAGLLKVDHLNPTGDLTPFGKYDFHLDVDWGEDGLGAFFLMFR